MKIFRWIQLGIISLITMPAMAWGINFSDIAPIGVKTPLGTDLPATLGNIFDIAIVVAGILMVVLLLVGGLMYLTSAGEPEKTKKATQLMLDAIIGLVIVVIAYPVGDYILGQNILKIK